ncbi:hypothetical protein ES703_97247 [subsurface metagenome]
MVKTKSRFVAIECTKIADITESDTDNHILDLTGIVPPGTVCLFLRCERRSGSGDISGHPKNTVVTTVGIGNQNQKCMSVLPIKYPDLMYHQGVANDDWDVYLFGYIVESRTR